MRTCALEETNKCFSYCLNWAWTALRCANRKRRQYQVPTPAFCFFSFPFIQSIKILVEVSTVPVFEFKVL